MPRSSADPEISSWKPLFLVAGWSCLLNVPLSILWWIVYLKWPPPATVTGWFALLHDHWLIGLMDMDLISIVTTVLTIPAFIALYAALRRSAPSSMAIALGLGMTGLATYCSSVYGFNMLSLANQYSTATAEADKAVFLAAGQMTLTNWLGINYFSAGMILEAVAFIIFSVVMIRSAFFTKTLAYLGILAGIFWLTPPIPPYIEFGTIGGTIAMSCTTISFFIWDILMGLRFLKLGRGR